MKRPVPNTMLARTVLVNTVSIGLLLIILSLSQPLLAHNHADENEDAARSETGESKKHHRKQHPEMAEHMIKRTDSNGDGKVDLDEFLAHSQERFQAMDADSDGYVTQEEMRLWGKERRVKHRKAKKEASMQENNN